MPTLFGALRPDYVHTITLYEKMGWDESVYTSGRDQVRPDGPRYDHAAQARALKTLTAEYAMERSLAKPYTWDFDANRPRPYSPLVAMITVIQFDPEAQRGRIQSISAYRVDGLPDGMIECRQAEGGPVLPWHWNSWAVRETELNRVIAAVKAATVEESVKEQPFWKSKKFVYALATLIAALVIALLPSLVTLDAATLEMLNDLLPVAVALGAFVLLGHQFNDALTLAKGIQSKPLAQAAHEMVDAIFAPPDPEHIPEDAPRDATR